MEDCSYEDQQPTRAPWPDDAPVLVAKVWDEKSERWIPDGCVPNPRPLATSLSPQGENYVRNHPADEDDAVDGKNVETQGRGKSQCHPHRSKRKVWRDALQKLKGQSDVPRGVGMLSALSVVAEENLGVTTQMSRAEELTEAETVHLLSAAHYRVRGAVRSSEPPSDHAGDTFAVIDCVVDTGSGLNFISEKALSRIPHVQRYSVPARFPVLVGASRTRIDIRGVVKLVVNLGEQRDEILLLIASQLPADVILGTQYLETAVHAIYPGRRALVMENGACVHMASRHDGSQAVKVAKRSLVPANCTVTVPVTCKRQGLSLMQPTTRKGTVRKTHAAAGLIDLPGQPGEISFIEVSNFSDRDAYLAPRQVVAYATAPPSLVSLVSPKDNSKGTAEVEDWRSKVDLAHLESSERSELMALLEKYQGQLDGSLGSVRGAVHRIDTQGHVPIHQQPRRAGPAQRQIERKECERMLAEGVIQPSQSEWSSPVVLVAKKDGSTRFCVDYRKLNTATRKDCYPLPKLDEHIDSLGGAAYFSTLDANSGYWQIPVAPEDREKTAFVCHAGFFEFLRMPFGLCNAPATFQRTLDILLAGVRFDYALVYLDDIIVYSSTFSEHLRHLDHVLSLLKSANVTLKLEKCRFASREVEYLGHLIKPGKLELKYSNVRALAGLSYPRTKTELRSFLGTCNVYRRFVRGFASIARPLTDLTKDDIGTDLPPPGEKELKAFEELRNALLSPPTLALPRGDRQFVVDTDASKEQFGAVLQQKGDDGRMHPVGYWSRVLTSAERNYSATELEAAAIVWAVSTLRHYLEGTRFQVRTDHQALSWLFGPYCSDNSRLARFRLKLAAYDFTVSYLPANRNRAADGFSRLETTGCCTGPSAMEDCEEIPLLLVEKKELPARVGPLVENVNEWNAITVDEMRKAQAEDPECVRLKVLLACEDTVARCLYGEDDRGLLVRISPLDKRIQVVVPKQLQERVLALAHYPKLCGHPRGTALFANLRREFYWPGMSSACHAFVSRCPSCAAQDLKAKRRRTAYLKLFMPNGPLEFVCVDILGPLPTTRAGNKYLLVISDRFSKLTLAVPLPDIRAETVARAFFERWLSVYGVPLVCLSDNGTNFRSKFFQSVCTLLGIKNLFSTPYHPQTQGQVERFNRTILAKLTHHVSKTDQWDNLVAGLTFNYNCSVHASTGYSPFELVIARPPRVPILEPAVTRKEGTRAEIRASFLKHLQANAEATRETLRKAQARYKANHDRAVRQRNEKIEPGDEVFVKTYTDVVGSPKLVTPAAGPYKVCRRDDTTFTVSTPSGKHRVHSDRVVLAPAPADLPENVRYAESEVSSDEDEVADVSGVEEYVVERIVAHKLEGSQLYLKVRWYGYAASDDTWELAEGLPEDMVNRYARRKKLTELWRR